MKILNVEGKNVTVEQIQPLATARALKAAVRKLRSCVLSL